MQILLDGRTGYLIKKEEVDDKLKKAAKLPFDTIIHNISKSDPDTFEVYYGTNNLQEVSEGIYSVKASKKSSLIIKEKTLLEILGLKENIFCVSVYKKKGNNYCYLFGETSINLGEELFYFFVIGKDRQSKVILPTECFKDSKKTYEEIIQVSKQIFESNRRLSHENFLNLMQEKGFTREAAEFGIHILKEHHCLIEDEETLHLLDV